MGLFDAISDLFAEGTEEEKHRRKVKRKFSEQLKKQLALTEDEVQAVLAIIEEYETKYAKIKRYYSSGYNSDRRIRQMHSELVAIQDELKQDLEGIIKFIMRSKLNKAKAIYGGGR